MSRRLRTPIRNASRGARCGAAAAALALTQLVLSGAAAAQQTRSTNASAHVSSLGKVTATSPLAVRSRTTDGNVYVAGTITTIHNGPQQVQVQLSSPLRDSVYARTATGAYLPLSTTTWVTVASGPGAKSTVFPVDYYVVWARGSARSPQNATSIPVAYRVAP